MDGLKPIPTSPTLFYGLCGTVKVHPIDEDLSMGTPKNRALIQSEDKSRSFDSLRSLRMTSK
jgi:hypothetical protein